MKIDIGKDVIASDGEKIGTVDRLVLDSETNDLRKFVVHKGMLWSEDRIVDLDLVSEVDSEGNLHLRVPSDDEDTMPRFVEETHRVASDEEISSFGYESFIGTAPYAPILFAPGATGGQYRPGAVSDEYQPRGVSEEYRPGGVGEQYEPGRGTFFDAPDTVGTSLEHTTNLPEDSITIDKGTNVVGRDGDKVGEVEELITDEHGRTTGFLVKAGFLFTHDVRIPMDLVDHMGGKEITLKVNGDEAENMQSS